MESFSSFFGSQSQSASRNSWTYDSLKNFRQISPVVQTHLKKVAAKRTNVPGMKQFRGRRPNPYAGFNPRRPFMAGPPIYYSPYGYGRIPRARRPMRYRPY